MPTKTNGENGSKTSAATTSELNNLLQIISGTASQIENIWSGSSSADKYFAMLRASIDRAAKITAQLAEHSGGTTNKMVMHPELSAFAPKPVPLTTAHKKCILIVDDEPIAALLMKKTFSDAGFQALTARSGFECLDVFRRQHRDIDLIILDLTMPFMDGEETFERIRKISADVPVVLTTGFMEQAQLERLLSIGLAGFLRKPHAPEEALACVNSILESSTLRKACNPKGIAPALPKTSA